MIPIFPGDAAAVMRTGLPNAYPPISITLNPFTWPMRDPVVSMKSRFCSIISRIFVSIRLWRSILESSASRICFGGNHVAFVVPRDVGRFASQIRQIEKARGNFPAPPRQPHPMLQNRRKRVAVERQQLFVVADFTQAPGVLADHRFAPLHFLVEFDAHLENLFEVFLEIVKQLVHVAVADQDDLHVHVDRFRLHAPPC